MLHILRLTAILSLAAVAAGAATLDTHEVALDGDGKLLSWVQPADQAFARVMFLSWDFLKHRSPVDVRCRDRRGARPA